jgi:hypothetical protein
LKVSKQSNNIFQFTVFLILFYQFLLKLSDKKKQHNESKEPENLKKKKGNLCDGDGSVVIFVKVTHT